MLQMIDAENLFHSWNHHRILGPQGCVPVENMAQTSCAVQSPAELIPTVIEAVRMCEERGDSLACDTTLGTDPLVMRADLTESCERLFFSMQPSIEYFVDNSTYPAGFLTR